MKKIVSLNDLNQRSHLCKKKNYIYIVQFLIFYSHQEIVEKELLYE